MKVAVVSRITLIVCLGVIGACGDKEDAGSKGTIHIKGIIDLSGATTDISLSAHAGIRDHIAHINRNGGIQGYDVEIDWSDYGYVGTRAVEIYEEWRTEGSFPEVVTVLGWGTPDSWALRDLVNEDQIPFIGESYLADLGDPSVYPYNFYIGTDYDTSARIAMSFIKERGGHNVGFVYCSPTTCSTYGSGPIPGAKQKAEDLGLALMPDVTVEMAYYDDGGAALDDAATRAAIRATMQEYFVANPDVEWIWVGNTTRTTAMIIEAGALFKPEVRFVVNVWGFDENLDARCEDSACRGTSTQPRTYGIVPFAAYGDASSSSEMVNLIEVHDAAREDAGESLTLFSDVRYVQGYARVLVWKKAVERILGTGKEVTRPNVKWALEQARDDSTGGLTAPVTITPEDHRPNSESRMYSLGDDGHFKFEAVISLDLTDF